MRLMNSVIHIGTLMCTFAFPAFSQVTNQTDVYENVTSCAAYQSYLNKVEISAEGRTDCDLRTTFLLENGDSGISRFLREYLERSEEYSTFYSIVEMLQSDVRSYTLAEESARAYLLAESAKAQVYSAFVRGGDEERAILYSTLIFGIKKRLLLRDLNGNSPIAKALLANDYLIADMLGSEFGHLDTTRPSFALICLLRTDNFRVDVSGVLLSNRMNSCLNEN